ncbi:hypothetical protein M422DRAFT_63951 [Sphaerobolus stellatus SS14]|nr:hypothetical protein M422DRAFT_63951 [Sphaerobolus stellatus SS14]
MTDRIDIATSPRFIPRLLIPPFICFPQRPRRTKGDNALETPGEGQLSGRRKAGKRIESIDERQYDIPRSSVTIAVHPPPTPATNPLTPLYESKQTNNSLNSGHPVFPYFPLSPTHPNTQTQTQAKESPYIQDQNILTYLYLNGPIYPSYKRHAFRVWCRNLG